MARKVEHKNLTSAKTSKNDEFYTQLSDIERELKHYKNHFKDKVVFCNCDDPRISNFFHFFSYNFEKFGLKKLITTCYKNQERDLFSENTSEHAIYLVSDRKPYFPDFSKNYFLFHLKNHEIFRWEVEKIKNIYTYINV